MKSYYVGQPMALPGKEAALNTNSENRKIFEKQITSRSAILLYKNYHEARQAAQLKNGSCPIFTVEFEPKEGQQVESLPRTIQAFASEITFLNASFAHVENGKIYEIKEDPEMDELDELMINEIANMFKEAQGQDKGKDSAKTHKVGAEPTWGVIAMQSMLALTAGSLWYFTSHSAPETLALSLAVGTGTFFAQKFNLIKNLQKGILKQALGASIAFITKSVKKAPQKPEVFLSPEEELEFNMALRATKTDNSQTIKLMVSVAIDTLFGDKPDLLQSTEDETSDTETLPAHSNVLLFQSPEAASRPTRETNRKEYSLRTRIRVNYRGL